MRSRSARTSLVIGLAAGALVVACERGPAVSLSDPLGHDGAVDASILPPRRATHSAARDLPDVPPELVDPPAVTVDLETRRTDARGTTVTAHQRISRGPHHVHVSNPDDEHEWLFEQNPLDPRRVSGTFIDHRARVVVEYAESALALEQGLDGWATIAALRLDPRTLTTLQWSERSDSGRRRVVREYRAPADDRASALRHATWSPELAIPTSYEVVDGTTRVRAEAKRIEAGVDAVVFEAPLVRFPTYAVRDVADWREERH